MAVVKHQGLETLKTLYVLGAVISAFLIYPVLSGDRTTQEQRSLAWYGYVFPFWGGLIWASAYLAVKKGRELVEGAVLGAFGPLGFIIEVVLPPIRDHKE